MRKQLKCKTERDNRPANARVISPEHNKRDSRLAKGSLNNRIARLRKWRGQKIQLEACKVNSLTFDGICVVGVTVAQEPPKLLDLVRFQGDSPKYSYNHLTMDIKTEQTLRYAISKIPPIKHIHPRQKAIDFFHDLMVIQMKHGVDPRNPQPYNQVSNEYAQEAIKLVEQYFKIFTKA